MVDRPLVSLLLIALPLIVLFAMEILSRRTRVQPEVTRKISHIVLGSIAVLGFLEGPIWLYAASIAALSLYVFTSLRKKRLRSPHGVERSTYGALFLPLGLLAPLPLTFDAPEVYIFSILIVTFADSAAGLVGFLLKRTQKSMLGSTVFFAVTALILFAYPLALPPFALIGVAVAVTLVERYSIYGSDNLTIPLAATALLLLF